MYFEIKFDHKFSGDPYITHFEFFINLFEVIWLRKNRRNGELVSKFIRSKAPMNIEGKRISKVVRNKLFETIDKFVLPESLYDDRFSDTEDEDSDNCQQYSNASSIQIYHYSDIRRRIKIN